MDINLLPDKIQKLYEWLLNENNKNPGINFLTNEVSYNFNLTLASDERLTITTIRKWLKELADHGLIKRKVKRGTARFSKSKIYIFSFK